MIERERTRVLNPLYPSHPLHMPQLPHLPIPAPTPFQIDRTGLAERIRAAGSVRLVVLRAPAGFGKTTAMLQHAARVRAAGGLTSWLTLDAGSNDLTRFIAHLGAAVAEVAPPAAGAQEGGVLELMERLAASPSAFTLFIDDFEVIQSSPVLDVIRQLLERMPAGWQVVIGSRISPDLRLGRLRAHGQLVEIGLEQLRFTPAETREFLCSRRSLKLSPAVLDRLQQLTEGWATALWLASVALENHPQPEAFLSTFSGSDEAITEFLAEDVLDRQPDDVRDFLLRTSVLRDLVAGLCDAVLERHDSAAMLQQLGRANLFLLATDSPGHYRYHSLFADFLRAQLRQRDPAAEGRLHLRAAQWYEEQDRPVPAIEHALRASDQACVVRLLEAHAYRLLDVGRFRLLSRWLEKLPAAVREAHPRLLVLYGWALAFTHRFHESLALLDRIEVLRRDGGAGWENGEVQAHLLALHPLLLAMTDHSQALQVSMENHARLDPRYGLPYSVLTNSLAFLQAGQNDYDGARALLERARRSHFEIGSTFSLVIAECLEGAISLRQGRLQDALARFRVAMNNMASEDSPGTDGHALAAIQFAEALYESGQPEQAEHLLGVYLPLASDFALADYAVRGYLTRSRLAWHRGEEERAFGMLGELEYRGHQDNSSRLVMCAELERSRLALLRGDANAAAAYLKRAEGLAGRHRDQCFTVPLHDVESVELARLRLQVRGEGALAEALEALPPAIAQARAQQCHRLALHLTLLWVEALQRSGQATQSAEQLAAALAAAAPQGIVQPFADEGPVVAALTLAALRHGDLRTRAPVFAERLEAACTLAAGSAAQAEAEAAAAPAGGAGPADGGLTMREIHVLKLLAQGKSNAGIAQSLFVSENTVRTHMRNISSKLGASNRTEVVVLARKQGLIA